MPYAIEKGIWSQGRGGAGEEFTSQGSTRKGSVSSPLLSSTLHLEECRGLGKTAGHTVGPHLMAGEILLVCLLTTEACRRSSRTWGQTDDLDVCAQTPTTHRSCWEMPSLHAWGLQEVRSLQMEGQLGPVNLVKHLPPDEGSLGVPSLSQLTPGKLRGGSGVIFSQPCLSSHFKRK